jgi:23S rRNA pseudouridine1911/1915/1917 synthase
VNALTRVFVDATMDGERLDICLAAATSLSRRAARRLIGDGGVWRNGEPVRIQSRTVDEGDVLEILRPADELGVPARPEAPPISILYRDRWLLVADKPAGVLTQPDESSEPAARAFDRQVLASVALADGRRPFLRLIHRLDRMTSGAVLFACNPSILRALSRSWAEGAVDRHYLAVVEGEPAFERRRTDRPIARDQTHRWRFVCDDGGKSASTEVSVVDRPAPGITLVRCRLVTGRTHQVRVHLADLGHPVLGDRLYGSQRAAEVKRPLLHAYQLVLPHPQRGTVITVTSPVPDDMAPFVPASSGLAVADH